MTLHNVRLITNSDETITSLRWRTAQHRNRHKLRSLKQSNTMATSCTLILLQAVNCLPCKNYEQMLRHRAVCQDDCTGAWILCTAWYAV